MNPEKTPVESSKSQKNLQNKLDSNNLREKIKMDLSKKYNISLEESERLLQKIVEKNLEKQKNNPDNGLTTYVRDKNAKSSSDNSLTASDKDGEVKDSSADVGILDKKGVSEKRSKKVVDSSEDKKGVSEKRSKKVVDSSGNTPDKINIANSAGFEISAEGADNLSTDKESSKKDKISDVKKAKSELSSSKKSKDGAVNDNNSSSEVDELLNDILPDYEKPVAIELKNVNLTFEIQLDRIDTIKEYVIRRLRREKIKKMKLHALKDVSLKIYKGEKVGIVGFNGAGKSTLLKVICGIYPPDDGEVITKGNISPFLSLGLGFNQQYSGRKNIFLNGAVLGYDKEFIEKKEQEIIDFTELNEFIDVPIKNYSSGMKAKLGFAIATAVEPDILVLDEVLGVGDAAFKRKSRDKMNYMMGGGTTVLFVSHSIPQVRSICDKAIWIDEGRIVEIGEVNKVCDNYLKAAEKASKEQLENIQMT